VSKTHYLSWLYKCDSLASNNSSNLIVVSIARKLPVRISVCQISISFYWRFKIRDTPSGDQFWKHWFWWGI